MIRNLSLIERIVYSIFRWKNFPVPPGELVDCYKDRSLVGAGMGAGTDRHAIWGNNELVSAKFDVGKVGTDGVGFGVPMQLGRNEYRNVTWGSGYGRVQQIWARIPLPALGNRYWVTGYPTPMFDKHCVIMDVDGSVHELIKFDQDAPVLIAGLPQQALNYGRWKNGVLISGVPVTRADLPLHAYTWGAGSINNPHCQAFTVQDYRFGDGSKEFAAQWPDGCACGEWFYLPEDSPSYRAMFRLGGECRARAVALNMYGARLIDRGGRTSFHTQAGSWADATNTRDFTIDIRDLRYAR